jgi:hypothetical protein
MSTNLLFTDKLTLRVSVAIQVRHFRIVAFQVPRKASLPYVPPLLPGTSSLLQKDHRNTTSKVANTVMLHATAQHDTTGMDSMRHDLRAALDEVPPKCLK